MLPRPRPVTLAFAPLAGAQPPPDPSATSTPPFPLVQPTGTTDLVIDPADYPVVRLAANLLADDISRVTVQRPAVRENMPQASQIILLGTLGHNAHLDELARTGKLAHLDKLRGGWETTFLQTVDHPWPGVERALVIAGSDRRGAAYGAMELSERIGVSPWYWWADVPVPHQPTLTLPLAAPEVSSPSVKYRGIFINDEDWASNPGPPGPPTRPSAISAPKPMPKSSS